MVDTARTKVALHALWPLNVTGLVTVQTGRDLIETVLPMRPGGVRVVAASNADLLTRVQADVECSGASDEVEINAQLVAVSAAGGGVVRLTPGAFSFAAAIVLPSNVRLEGAGDGLTVLTLANGANAHAVLNSDLVAGNVNIQIAGITFDFNGANQAGASGHGIRMAGVDGFRLERCTLRNAWHHNVTSAVVAGVPNKNWLISNCISTGAGTGTDGDGFRPNLGFDSANGPTCLVVNCIAIDAGHHNFHFGSAVRGVNCQAFDAGQSNYYLENVGASIANCSGFGTGEANVSILADSCEVNGGYFDGSGSSTTDVIRVNTGGTNAKIEGATVVNSQRHGINTTVAGTRVLGCYIANSAGSGFNATTADNAVLEGNRSTGNVLRGIAFETGVNPTITGNRCDANSQAGIRIGSAVTGAQVSVNNVLGNATVGIQDLATGSMVRGNVGWVTEASGTATIASGATSVVVTHGLNFTPTLADISITLGENPTNDPGNVWPGTFTATQFTVNCRNDPGASNLDLAWQAMRL